MSTLLSLIVSLSKIRHKVWGVTKCPKVGGGKRIDERGISRLEAKDDHLAMFS